MLAPVSSIASSSRCRWTSASHEHVAAAAAAAAAATAAGMWGVCLRYHVDSMRNGRWRSEVVS